MEHSPPERRDPWGVTVNVYDRTWTPPLRLSTWGTSTRGSSTRETSFGGRTRKRFCKESVRNERFEPCPADVQWYWYCLLRPPYLYQYVSYLYQCIVHIYVFQSGRSSILRLYEVFASMIFFSCTCEFRRLTLWWTRRRWRRSASFGQRTTQNGRVSVARPATIRCE